MSRKEKMEELKLAELNRAVFEAAEHYRKLQIFGCEIICPYYINRPIGYLTDLMRKVGIGEEGVTKFYNAFKSNEAPYGWFQGKGTPEEIESSIAHFLPYAGFGRPKVTPEGIRDLMRLRGIGVDCSGFVFNILNTGFNKLGMSNAFYKSIKWKDNKKQNVFQAGVNSLAESSFEISVTKLQALDLLVMEKRGHIAIVLEDENKYLKVYQSTPWISPSGVNVSSLLVKDGDVKFSFIPSMGDSWEDMFKKGQIEFRRLNVFR